MADPTTDQMAALVAMMPFGAVGVTPEDVDRLDFQVDDSLASEGWIEPVGDTAAVRLTDAGFHLANISTGLPIT